MREKAILITGANGEVGHGLIQQLASDPNQPAIIVLDLAELDESLHPLVKHRIKGSILDSDLLEAIHDNYALETIFHLAALLSTTAERQPQLAHEVNVNGTLRLLEMARANGQASGQAVKFIYPSSIAVYGLPDLVTKAQSGAIGEDAFLNPTTMYGCNKLYCEHLGRYYAEHFGQLSDEAIVGVDFRCVRFPGLISAFTVPSGGTSDFAPEMIHAAAQGKAYDCFVREDSIIPFMAMPDAIQALLKLAQAPRERLTRLSYNVTAFSVTAGDVAALVKKTFTGATISYRPSAGRQGIVDTWPLAIDDAAARADWDWSPQYDFDHAFTDYLIPNIRERYQPISS